MYTLKDGVLTIDDGVTEILKKDFSFDKKDIKSVIIPDGVKKIGGLAFNRCENLTSVTIPESVKEIGGFAFAGCAINNCESKLLKIKNGCAMTDDGLTVLYGTNSQLTEISIPEGIKIIGDEAFAECKKITKVIIPEGVKKICVIAFCRCKKLSEVIIPESVEEIEGGAFEDCKNLTTVKIPETVKVIGDLTFDGCTNLKKIIYQGTKEEWENIEGDFKKDLKGVEIIFEE